MSAYLPESVKVKLLSLENYIRGKDNIVQPCYKYLHTGDEKKQKTFFAGLCNVSVKVFIIYLAYTLATKVLDTDQRENLTVESTFEDYWDKVYLKDMSKILLEVW